MVVSDYFTDEELETQIRLQFDDEKQWNMDFKTIFSTIEDIGDYLLLRLRGRTFHIDKVTACVVEVGAEEEEING